MIHLTSNLNCNAMIILQLVGEIYVSQVSECAVVLRTPVGSSDAALRAKDAGIHSPKQVL